MEAKLRGHLADLNLTAAAEHLPALLDHRPQTRRSFARDLPIQMPSASQTLPFLPDASVSASLDDDPGDDDRPSMGPSVDDSPSVHDHRPAMASSSTDGHNSGSGRFRLRVGRLGRVR